MAIVLRGKMKGQKVTPAQWCNNWVSVKELPKIFSITALEFTPEELYDILTTKDLGCMLGAFEQKENRFVRRKRKC